MNPNILIVDDDRDFLDSLCLFMVEKGLLVKKANSVKEGISLIDTHSFDLLLTDLKMPSGTGIDLLNYVCGKKMNLPVIILTGYATLDTSIMALRLKAADYLLKPIDPLMLYERIINTIKKTHLSKFGEKTIKPGKYGIVGSSKPMKGIYRQIAVAGQMDYSVLITGESGTGKELSAAAIHNCSVRKDFPFIVANCAALGDTLFHSEMFGYKKGSFTGATESHQGYFKTADRGTLFLDEIGELSIQSQVKLLRTIETGMFNPVGDPNSYHADVRIISATNRDLGMEVDNGNFRLDLFYRLNTFHIHLPSLKERKGDIPRLLVDHFIAKNSIKLRKEIKGVSQEVIDKMTQYSWPGNLRQLENMIVCAMAVSDKDILTLESFPDLKFMNNAKVLPQKTGQEGITDKEEIDNINAAMIKAEGNVTLAALLLKVNKVTLYRKIKKHAIDMEKYRSQKELF